MYNMKFAISTILSVQFIGIRYIRNVVQPSPHPFQEIHLPKQKLCPHGAIIPLPFPPLSSSWRPRFYFLSLQICLF